MRMSSGLTIFLSIKWSDLGVKLLTCLLLLRLESCIVLSISAKCKKNPAFVEVITIADDQINKCFGLTTSGSSTIACCQGRFYIMLYCVVVIKTGIYITEVKCTWFYWGMRIEILFKSYFQGSLRAAGLFCNTKTVTCQQCLSERKHFSPADSKYTLYKALWVSQVRVHRTKWEQNLRAHWYWLLFIQQILVGSSYSIKELKQKHLVFPSSLHLIYNVYWAESLPNVSWSPQAWNNEQFVIPPPKKTSDCNF